MLKHLSKPGLGQRGYELVRRHGCLWELAWENTEYRNCWYAMPSISFMNCELLSGALTDNIVRACQHSSANVKGNWHVSTATFSLLLLPFFFFLFPESIWWRRPECEIGVRGQIPLCSDVQGNYIFYTFRKNFPTSPQLSHMGAHMDCSGNERTAFVAV